jgi:chloride channel protein, CIC family
MRARWLKLLNWFNTLGLDENTVLMVFAVGVGAASAVGVVAFYKAIDLAFTLFFRIPGEQVSRSVFAAYRPVVTGLGLMAAYIVMRRLGRGADGMNVPDVQVAVARRGGFLSLRPALARTAASVVTLGSGGSAGSEGPVAVLGSTVGSWIARVFGFDSNQVKVMVGAGAAASISAAFNAPLAGAFFALEEILGTFSPAAFAPIVISSVVGALVSRAVFGNHPAFPIPEEYGFALSTEILVLYPLLGIVCGLVAVFFIRTYFRVQDVAARFDGSPLLLAAAGGAIVGLLVFLSSGVLVGYGHLAVRIEVFGRLAWYALALLVVGKVLATSITLHFGGSGGVFTPALYVGAATGGAFGSAARDIFPRLDIAPEAYAIVGMGALVATATGAPITGILIVFEMTNDYAIVPALMMVVAISMVLTHKLEADSLYSGYLRRRGERLPHNARPDVMSDLRIGNVLESTVAIRSDASLDEVLDRAALSNDADLPVVAVDRQVVGMIILGNLAGAGRGYADGGKLIIAADLAEPTDVVVPRDPILSAIQKMGRRGVGTLPVVDPESGALLGIVTRKRILAAYEQIVT